jgi:hypothetical protein
VVADKAGVLICSCCTVLSKDVKMYDVWQHIIPRILTQEQCNNHMKVSDGHTSTAGNDLDFPQMIVKSYET